MNRHLAALEPFDLGGIDVDAYHMVAGIRQAGPRDEADVAGAENRHAHYLSS